MRLSTLVKITGVGVVALGVAGVAMLMTVDVNQYRGIIEQQVETATGRALTIAGPMDLSISLTPAVVIEDVAVANAPWGSRADMLTARRLEAQVELLPLLRGEIKIDRVVLVGADLLLEIKEDGTANWVLDTPASTGGDTASQGRTALPDLRLVRIEDAVVTLSDRTAGSTRRLDLAAFEAAAEGWSAPLVLSGSGKLDAAAFMLEGRLGPLAALMTEGGAPYPVALKVGIAGATVSADGTLAKPLAGTGADLKVSIDAPEPETLAAVAGVSLADDVPPLRFDGRIADTAGGWTVDNLAASLGDTSIAGRLAVGLKDGRPQVAGNLSSPRLDLAKIVGPSTGGDAPAPAARLFPNDPLPLDLLGLADVDLELAVQTLVLPDGMELSPLSGSVSLANRRLDLKPLTAGVGGGTVRVVGALDASRGPGAVLSLDLSTREVVLGRLLEQVGQGGAIKDGPVEAAVTVSGRGTSIHGIMDTLDGALTVTIGAGTIDNAAIQSWTQDVALRLIDSLNPFAAKDRYTVMQCGVVKLSLKDGIATSDRGIAVETPKFSLAGSGTIDLGAETLDLAVKTAVREGTGIATANLANLVRIQGPILKPGVGIDPLGAARTAVSIGGAIASGGLSLLAETLIDRTTGDSNACEVALGTASAAPAATPEAARTEPAPGGAPPAQAAPADPVEGIGNALKGLFGQ